MDPALEDWLALRLLPGLGPASVRVAIERFHDPGLIAFRLPPSALEEVPGLRGDAIARMLAGRAGLRRRAEVERRRAERLGIRIVPLDAPSYPAELRDLHDPPTVLYCRGVLDAARVRVAVVGSRRATAYGRRVAAGLGAGLAERAVEVVSGGARGIDACAHAGCLDAGGRTVAILGSGFGRPYPEEHAPLFERIAASGAVLSEFLVDDEPRPEHFPRRNRLIAALAAAVVVVEAAPRSGSFTTAGHALDLGKDVMAVPGPVSSELSAGCHRLIQQGAKLVQRVDDVLDELSPMYRDALRAGPTAEGAALPRALDLTDDERAVLGLFDDPEPVHVDRLAEATPLGIARLQAALFGLVLKGAVEQLTGGYYLAASPKPGR